MIDIALLVLRVWLGVVMVAHGINHGRSLEGTARWFASKGFRKDRLNAVGSAVGEVAIGAGLTVGLLTSFAAAGLIIPMVVAFWSIHRFAGFFVFKRPDEGWEYVATLAVAATVVAMTGPGRYSIDHVLGWADLFDGAVGLMLIIGGVTVAVVQLATMWRRPG